MAPNTLDLSVRIPEESFTPQAEFTPFPKIGKHSNSLFKTTIKNDDKGKEHGV